MAAREHPALQIALTIFVMLTIVLTVSMFLFFRNYQEEQLKNKTLVTDNDTKKKAADAANLESEQYKVMIGAAPTDKAEAIGEAAKKDIETYGKGIPAEKQNYRELTRFLATEL